MATFYQIDTARISLREYAWGSPWILLPLLFILKLFRFQLPVSTDDPPVDSVNSFQIDGASLPPEVRLKLQPLAEDLASHGFHSPVFHFIPDERHATRVYWATFFHSSGQTVARIHYRVWTGVKPAKEFLFPVFISRFADQSYLMTSSGKPDLLAPTSIRFIRLIGATPGALWDSHRRELTQESFQRGVESVHSQTEMLQFIEQHHQVIRDFHLQRQVFRQIPSSEETFVMTSTGVEVQASGMPNADVLVELDRLQRKRTSWVATILVLFISLGMFATAGFKDNAWGGRLLLLIGVLFFHELGHYVAMKMFNYRDVKMFFIPFLGAAVIGRHYNVPGWKKAVVSLMGPLPGIALGMVLGIIALAAGKPILIPAATMLLLLNGFNLIPMLPLDGGWVVHTTLFCRHPLLDVGFRLGAAMLLLLIGVFTPGHLTIFFAIALLLGLPMAYRTAKIADKLRRQGVPALSNDAQTVPLEAAQMIIGEIRTAMPTGLNTRLIAQHTLNIFETLNARPPNLLASFVLLGVHGMGFLLALVCAIVFTLAEHGNFRDMALAVATQPRHYYRCGESTTWRGAQVPENWLDNRITVVAVYPRRAKAEDAFHEFPTTLPANSQMRLFGSSVLISFPENDSAVAEQWQKKLEGMADEVYLASVAEPTMVNIMCSVPTETEAKAIEQESHLYFNGVSMMRLVPPWSPTDNRAGPERAAHDKARQTFDRVIKLNTDVYNDPAYKTESKKLSDSMVKGDKDAMTKFFKSHQELIKGIRREHFKKLRQDQSTPMDLEVVDLYEQILNEDAVPVEKDGPDPRWAALGARMGQLPMEGNQVKHGENRYSTDDGSVARYGVILRFNDLSFEQLDEGATAFAEWLCRRKCTDVKFDFVGGFGDVE